MVKARIVVATTQDGVWNVPVHRDAALVRSMGGCYHGRMFKPSALAAILLLVTSCGGTSEESFAVNGTVVNSSTGRRVIGIRVDCAYTYRGKDETQRTETGDSGRYRCVTGRSSDQPFEPNGDVTFVVTFTDVDGADNGTMQARTETVVAKDRETVTLDVALDPG